MDCRELRNYLDAHMDGELDLVRTLEIDQHLQDCPACAAASQRKQALHQALGDPSLKYGAPAGLRKRLRSSLRKTRGRKLSVPALTWRALAAAAAILLLGMLAWTALRMLATPSTEDTEAQEVASSHVRSLMASSHLLDVESGDGHKVKPWFNGKVDFAPTVEDLKDEGYPLLGGRLDYINNRKAAALVYKRREHFINLFMWPAESKKDSAPLAGTRQGYHLLHWTRGELSYWVVSDLNEAELKEFVQLLTR